ncbi:Mor transcription activator family protein [Maledivibacter halophilus]|uniref:Mor transcription activator family protein n=1 Tax=Maledivibacter halophilus TaxID=36842 RepID=A0A1T5L6G6_9FIRM|nr:Mor transcription activator family protein [Maledivibacter halophilus]SKC68452.1 Mor transcription activator family protein [Maledivibacter halophilus]SKC71637.1 Mor transcription activator family protein [Maledivibacter halophilus]SKC80225.1 Mor transcription activator family protein [Maledivibacter halophilus]
MNKKLINQIQINDLGEPYSSIVDEIGLENTIKLAKIFGGSRIYFPIIKSLVLDRRDKEIREKFNGYNQRELAKQYMLSEERIRQICKEKMKQIRNKPLKGQISMFD